jgi:inhibitor of KinA sporulation pathway (predicted exonuclease)
VGAILCPFSTEQIDVTALPTFQSFVKPQIVPKITPFCTNLTGITQTQVDQGAVFPDMIEAWTTFLEQYGCTPSTVVFGSWTDFDIKQLRLELTRNNLSVQFPNWIDLQRSYKLNQKGKGILGVKKALIEQGLEFEGREHSAIDDAKNTMRLVPYCGWHTQE